jgi:hypothetical protein
MCDAHRRLAFRWLIKAEEYVPHAELAGLRNHLVASGVRLVSAMSRIRLPDVTQQVRVETPVLRPLAIVPEWVSRSARLCCGALGSEAVPLPCANPTPRQFLRKVEERLNPRKDTIATAGSTSSPGSSAGVSALAGTAFLRSQLLKLCSGMRGVVLSFETDEQLAASTDFLKQVNPLSHTASVKKSQVQALAGGARAPP